MSVPAKKRRTENEIEVTVKSGSKKKNFKVKSIEGLSRVVNYLKSNLSDDTVTPEEAFRDIIVEYGKPGALLQGARLKAGLTQAELAEKLGPEVQQNHISAMENGSRSISKKMAQRLAGVLKTDYRRFL